MAYWKFAAASQSATDTVCPENNTGGLLQLSFLKECIYAWQMSHYKSKIRNRNSTDSWLLEHVHAMARLRFALCVVRLSTSVAASLDCSKADSDVGNASLVPV